MKKWMIGLFSLVLVVGLLASCAPNEIKTKKQDKDSKKEEVITLGVMPSTDNIPFIIAQKEGYAKENGVSIKLEVFKSAPDRDAAFQAGELDGVITDLVGVAIYQQGGIDARIVAAPYDQFDLVVGDETVQSVADLKGKDVVFSSRTGTAYAVDMMLREAGLSMSDINVSEVPQVPARLELVKNKKAAAAILPEPFVTMSKASGLRVLQSTRDIGINPFVIAFTSEKIKEKESGIKGMFDAYNKASNYINKTDKASYIDLFIKEVGFPESLKEEIVIPDYGKIEQVKEEDVRSAFEWSKAAGLLEKTLEPKDVISDVYFK